MSWEVWVLDGVQAAQFTEAGYPAETVREPEGPISGISPLQLAQSLRADAAVYTAVLDLTGSANYVKRHIPGAWFVLRSELAQAVARIPRAQRYVLTCGSSRLARYAAADLARLTGAEVRVLEGGTLAWIEAGLALEAGETRLASPRTDRYSRPFEGTNHSHAAMQAYLDWEFGLLEQLERDGTHGFKVI